MLHILANPSAQSGAGKHRINTFIQKLKTEKIDAVLHSALQPDDTSNLLKSLHLTEQDHLLVIGGDGTVNNLVNNLELPFQVPVMLLPCGSGNDFARGIGLDKDTEKLIAHLKSDNHPDNILNLDLGQISSTSADAAYFPPLINKRFAVSCGFGLDAATCRALEQGKLKAICNKLHIGKLSYLLVGLKTISQMSSARRATITVTTDGNPVTFKKTAFVSVQNLRFEGGGFPFTPDASPTDGLLDVCIVHVPSRLHTLPLLIACLLGGKHTVFRRYVKILRCKSVTVTSDRPLPLHTDGEVINAQMGFTASVLERVLNLEKY
ncbi:MAG: diacylglycerol kinase family protein [Lachnospiraceae bacterium]|nr:diacylglycerol kinase family protein [Lachnospiraceae bacterium]